MKPKATTISKAKAKPYKLSDDGDRLFILGNLMGLPAEIDSIC